MTRLHIATSPLWVKTVLNDFNSFLLDHAAAEKKASGMAMSMVSHYPDKPLIVNRMIDLALEELAHFRQVVKLIHKRGAQLGADTPDTYINQLRQHQRKGTEAYLLDRLLLGSIIEARGCERFGLIAAALPEGELQQFYTTITESEARHDDLFITLAQAYFPAADIETRLNELLRIEASLVAQLPLRAALH